MDKDGCGYSGVWNNFSKIHLMMWLFRFITGITFKWDYMMWRINSLLIWIGLRNKWRIYCVPPDQFIWSFQVFGSL